MKFRLKKGDYGIELERFLKAVKVDEDYQKIRFMIKDGLISVNDETEYARRRLLGPGDKVTFKNNFYRIYEYSGEEPSRNEIKIPEERNSCPENEGVEPEQEHREERQYIVHHQQPLHWNQKYKKEEDTK